MDQSKPTKPGLIIATVLALLPFLSRLGFDTYISFNPDADVILSFVQIAFFIAWIVLFIFALPFAFWKKKGKYMLYWPVSMLLLWLSVPLFNTFPIPDYIHFSAELPRYAAVVKKSPLRDHIFFWGGTGFVGTISTARNLIYDPTDNIPIANEQKSRHWRQDAKRRHVAHPVAIMKTTPMGNHYYLSEEIIIPY